MEWLEAPTGQPLRRPIRLFIPTVSIVVPDLVRGLGYRFTTGMPFTA
jgi:hypothetical protein